MKKIGLIICISVIVSLNIAAKAEFNVPYSQNFDHKTVGSTFGDWTYPFGKIFNQSSNPYGVSVPFNTNYLFLSDSAGHSGIANFSETTDTINFGLDFISLPNPNYNPGANAFRGGAEFLIKGQRPDSYSREPEIGIEIHGEMWQNPDDLEVYFVVNYLDTYRRSIPIGTIEHNAVYGLQIELNQDYVNFSITNSFTNIFYHYNLNQTFLANGIMIWEGSYPETQYGVGIDNVIVTPEPASLFLILLGALLSRKK